MEKDPFEKRYTLARNIGIPVFKKIFHPKIIGKELIPEKGPIVFLGNHLHKYDQYPVICATDKIIHWDAKKEYFDGPLGFLYKQTGAIPVDRYGNPEEAKRLSLQYLNMGSSIGIFPEGTRNIYQLAIWKLEKARKNCLKVVDAIRSGEIHMSMADTELQKAYELYENAVGEVELAKSELKKRGIVPVEGEEVLPFKYGAVSFAQKTNAIIQPFSVTGQFTPDNQDLTLCFGKPFVVGDRPLEQANREARDKVLSLVREHTKQFNTK